MTFKSPSPDYTLGGISEGTGAPLRTLRPKTDPLWKHLDSKANKAGQRGTIYWVGKSIIGEDGAFTGDHAKGASYHGEWGENKKHGYGVQVFPNGEKYEGQWGGGVRNGEGTLWVPVGKAKKLRKLYVGGWKDDKRNGRGTCFFKNGEFFQGSWDQGKMHGHGTLRYENGDLYIGDWYNGLRSGQGTLNKANGDCYEGYWLDDKREGRGSHFYSASGKVFVGEWANDLPKAGVYTQANPNPEQATAVPMTTTLPPVRLALPSEVLDGALAAVRNARKSFRVRNTALGRLFSEDEVTALHAAFDGMQRDGVVGTSNLQALCSQLGTEVAMPRLRRLLADATATTAPVAGDADADVAVTFQDFLRIVALLLDEEAEANPGMSQGDMHSANDLWYDGNGPNDEEDIDPELLYGEDDNEYENY